MRLPATLPALLLAAVAFPDLPPAARDLMARMGVSAESFPSFIRRINEDTAVRERLGENDHLIFYVLQSREFTKTPPIEPARSAQEFVPSSVIPPRVERRFRDFLDAPVRGERMTYLRHLAPASGADVYIREQYERVMRSLYGKEFEQRADFYQTRGHSTDTQVPANYAVWTALSVLRATDPAFHPARVLIVGPGLDFAPRTALDDRYPPQSYQPFAVADALLSLGLTTKPKIHCVDINDRVIRFFEDFPKRHPAELRLFTPPGDTEYRAYFRNLGRAIGEVRPASELQKTVRLRDDIVRSVTASKLNIVTERESADVYDAIIATNVLIYFKGAELLLALANIQSMLAPGGVLIDNDLRPEIDAYALAAGLKAVQARTIQVAPGEKAPLYDAFAIYRK